MIFNTITNISTGGRNVLELLYTEGSEITPEDWGNTNLSSAGSSTGGDNEGLLIPNTKHKSIIFSPSQISFIGFPYNTNLEKYDSGANMVASYVNDYPLPKQAFNGCVNLTEITLGENCLPFSDNSFKDCAKLSKVRYLGTIDKWAGAARNTKTNNAAPFGSSQEGSFYLGDSTEPLTEIVLTTASNIITRAFYGFKDITKVDLGASVQGIYAYSFNNCYNLDTLILRGDTVKTLSSTNALQYTPIESGTGTIYIEPITVDEATLVAEYQAATNWSTFADQIKPFSEYVGG